MDASTNITSTPPIDPPARSGWPLPVQIVFGVIASGATLVTLLGNASVVLAFTRTRRLHTYANIYIVSLALTDFFGEFSAVPLRLNWVLGYWPDGLGDIGCTARNWSGTYFYHLGYLLVLVISLDRYFSVAYPIRHLTYRSTKVALCVISGAVAIVIVLWTPFFTYWEFVYDGDFRRVQGLCYPLYLSNIYVTVGAICTQTWLPILLMVTVYVKVYRIARGAISRKTIRISESKAMTSASSNAGLESVDIKICETAARVNPSFEPDDKDLASDPSSSGQNRVSANAHGSRTVMPDSESGIADNGPIRKEALSKLKKNQEKKALRTLTPIFISFMVSGLPWAIIAIVYVFCQTCSPTIVNESAVFLARTSSTMNPFCYAAVNPLYRQYFLKIVGAKNRRKQR
ncbi:muscarinic acetylcholine receptor M2-like [Patiria miniata]|uniref:G-protein coupled receptors family 1 profile domain-containing protein n=1 Tax=Patiria miniata TaxID=46514 RepID=A0A913Z0K9_PATMI|nr:muscarinic acetylcholine receptor M2-like [Patiria miniata]